MQQTFEEWIETVRTKKVKEKESPNEETGDKLWEAWNRNKAKNGGDQTDAVVQSGEEMQEIQQEPESEIEIGIDN